MQKLTGVEAVFNVSYKCLRELDIIILSGEVDMYVSPKIREALNLSLQRRPRAIAIDLTCVPYMDSAGIATLIEGLQWSRKEGGRFVLIGVQETVRETLKLAKLNELFETYPNEEEALASLDLLY